MAQSPNAQPVKVAVVGASGRMGQLVSRIIDEADEYQLAAAIGSADSLDLMNDADLVVDVTLPQVSQTIVEHAIAHGRRVLVGTSGWASDRIDALRRRVDEAGTGVVIVPNFSIGSVISSHLAAQAARYFDSIEIVETHHPAKIDSPSGTAVRTAELIGAARAELGPVSAPHVDQRARGQQVASVPIHSLRLAGVKARQQVVFGGVGETVTITHDTGSDESYVAGILLALDAARAASGVVVGLDAVLGLSGDEGTRQEAVTEGAPSGQSAATNP